MAALRVEQAGDTLRMTMDRPDRRNAFDADLIRELTEAFSEVKLGIIPSVISPFALAKIGESAARRYFVTGERFDAATAFRIGLVHEVAEDLDAAVERIVAELRTAGPEAARHAKQLVLERPDSLGTERRIAQRRTSDEGQEGLRAFLEKRKPSWASKDSS